MLSTPGESYITPMGPLANTTRSGMLTVHSIRSILCCNEVRSFL